MDKNTLQLISNQITAAFLKAGYEIQVNILSKSADEIFTFSDQLCQLSLDIDVGYPELSNTLFNLSLELDDYAATLLA